MATYRPADFSGLISDWNSAYRTSLIATESRRNWEMQDAERAVKGLNTFETIYRDEMDRYKRDNNISGDLTPDQQDSFDDWFNVKNPALVEGLKKDFGKYSGPAWAESGMTDPNEPIQIIKSALNKGKYMLLGKDKDGKTVPKTEWGSNNPDDPVLQLSALELARNARYNIATKYGLNPFSDMQIASRSVGQRIDGDTGAAANNAAQANSATSTLSGAVSTTSENNNGLAVNADAAGEFSDSSQSGGETVINPPAVTAPNTPPPGLGEQLASSQWSPAAGPNRGQQNPQPGQQATSTNGQMTPEGQVVIDDGTGTGNVVPDQAQPLGGQLGPMGNQFRPTVVPDAVQERYNEAQVLPNSTDGFPLMGSANAQNSDFPGAKLQSEPGVPGYTPSGNNREMYDDRTEVSNPANSRVRNATPEETAAKWDERIAKNNELVERNKTASAQADAAGNQKDYFKYEEQLRLEQEHGKRLADAKERGISDSEFRAEERQRKKLQATNAADANISESAQEEINQAKADGKTGKDLEHEASVATKGDDPVRTGLLQELTDGVAAGTTNPDDAGRQIVDEVGASGVQASIENLLSDLQASVLAPLQSESAQDLLENAGNANDFFVRGQTDQYTGTKPHPGTMAERMTFMAMATQAGFMPAGEAGLLLQRQFIQTGRTPKELEQYWVSKVQASNAVKNMVAAATDAQETMLEGRKTTSQLIKDRSTLLKDQLDREEQEIKIEQDRFNLKKAQEEYEYEQSQRGPLSVEKADKEMGLAVDESTGRIIDDLLTQRGGGLFAGEDPETLKRKISNDAKSYIKNQKNDLIMSALNQLKYRDPAAHQEFMDEWNAKGKNLSDMNNKTLADLYTRAGLNLDAVVVGVAAIEQLQKKGYENSRSMASRAYRFLTGDQPEYLRLEDYATVFYAANTFGEDVPDLGWSAFKDPLSKATFGLIKSETDEYWATLSRVADAANMPRGQLESYLMGLGQIGYNRAVTKSNNRKATAEAQGIASAERAVQDWE